jgi:hypothetical protein
MREFVGCPDFASTVPWQHVAHIGTVTGTVVGRAGIRVRTVGEGVNFTPRLAFTNAKLGDIAFDGLDTKTRNDFIDTFGTN